MCVRESRSACGCCSRNRSIWSSRHESNETRYPACNDVLKPLAAKYGKPEALAPRREEALQSFDYVWTQLPDAMKLECGRYRGRKVVFAIAVTFEQAAAR